MEVHIGCSGWYYRHWKGVFYPTDIPGHHWFKHYAKNFKTVELNAPFYRWPKDTTVKTWIRQSPDGFLYCIKVNRLITHDKRFVDTAEDVQRFSGIADMLGEKMGCFLFQLPPSMKYDKELLKNMLSQLDHSKKNVIEFRHKSWWNEETYAAMKKTGTIFCTVSGPRMPSDLVKTADDLYIRFHGITRWYRHEYTKEELVPWAEKIKRSKAKHVWIYFNNDFEGFAIKNAKMMAKMLK